MCGLALQLFSLESQGKASLTVLLLTSSLQTLMIPLAILVRACLAGEEGRGREGKREGSQGRNT